MSETTCSDKGQTASFWEIIFEYDWNCRRIYVFQWFKNLGNVRTLQQLLAPLLLHNWNLSPKRLCVRKGKRGTPGRLCFPRILATVWQELSGRTWLELSVGMDPYRLNNCVETPKISRNDECVRKARIFLKSKMLKFTLEQAMKTQMWSRGIGLLIL